MNIFIIRYRRFKWSFVRTKRKLGIFLYPKIPEIEIPPVSFV
jgi:hypothetical protein